MAPPPSDDSGDPSSRLRAHSEHLREKTKRRQQAQEWAQRAEAEISGTATASDGSVRVTVDKAGMLTTLEFSSRIREAKPEDLAAVVTTVVQQAAAHARNQVRRIYTELHDEGAIPGLPPHLLASPEVRQTSLPTTSESIGGGQPARRAPPDGPAEPISVLPQRTTEAYEEQLWDSEEEGPPATWFDVRPW